ncbi:hypothetical protein BC834DRAFT_898168 [Gloeopeniophorella convolvens]|nr:hypothetical protein BC834DRAFT_898168 [Gloeopeniophorella convolvens]
MASRQITLPVTGKFVWDLICDSDNTQNSGEIEHTHTLAINSSYNPSEFLRLVSDTTRKLARPKELPIEPGVSYEVVSAHLGPGRSITNETSNVLEKAFPKSQANPVLATEIRAQCKVGAKSKLYLYQRNFYVEDWPMYTSDGKLRTTSSRLTDAEAKEVPLVLTLRPVNWLVGMTVIYTGSASSAPADRVRDLHGGADDINKGFGGEYVWLVPIWSTDTKQALSGFDLAIQGMPDARFSDLAKGAGGDWRYLIPARAPGAGAFITDVRLVRRDSWAGSPPAGYTGQSGDINRGRKGDWLYLVWRTTPAYPI